MSIIPFVDCFGQPTSAEVGQLMSLIIVKMFEIERKLYFPCKCFNYLPAGGEFWGPLMVFAKQFGSRWGPIHVECGTPSGIQTIWHSKYISAKLLDDSLFFQRNNKQSILSEHLTLFQYRPLADITEQHILPNNISIYM